MLATPHYPAMAHPRRDEYPTYPESQVGWGSMTFPPLPTPGAQASQRSHSPNMQRESSAFSENANPDEDWTQISNLAERRRIQNRIAQRTYRKKLKARMSAEQETSSANTSPPGSSASQESRRSRKQDRRHTTQSQKPSNSHPSPCFSDSLQRSHSSATFERAGAAGGHSPFAATTGTESEGEESTTHSWLDDYQHHGPPSLSSTPQLSTLASFEFGSPPMPSDTYSSTLPQPAGFPSLPSTTFGISAPLPAAGSGLGIFDQGPHGYTPQQYPATNPGRYEPSNTVGPAQVLYSQTLPSLANISTPPSGSNYAYPASSSSAPAPPRADSDARWRY